MKVVVKVVKNSQSHRVGDSPSKNGGFQVLSRRRGNGELLFHGHKSSIQEDE